MLRLNSGRRMCSTPLTGLACRGKIETARRLHRMGARPRPASIMGTSETLNDSGMSLLLELASRARRREWQPARTRSADLTNLFTLSGG
jgi:hypothetical protein